MHKEWKANTAIPGSKTQMLLLGLPMTALLGYSCFARKMERKTQKVKKASIIFAKGIQVQKNSCHQPAEEIIEQTLLKTCKISISLSFQPLSVKANLYHKPSCRGCFVTLGQGDVLCLKALSHNRSEKLPLAPNTR